MEDFFLKVLENLDARYDLEKWALYGLCKKTELLPDVLVYAEQGSGVENFANYYAKILNGCDPEKKKGECFLALKYHYADQFLEGVHGLFFESPFRYARQQKRADFSGTVLIDMSEWEKVKSANHPVFQRLLQYLKENKYGLMKFCLWLPNSMKDGCIDKAIRSCLPLETVSIYRPGPAACAEYVETVLMNKDFFIDFKAKREVEKGFAKLMEDGMYKGYETIDHFIKVLLYRQNSGELVELCPTKETIRTAMEVFANNLQTETEEKRPKIGFA